MYYEGLGEIYKGYFSDRCAQIVPLMSIGDQAEGLQCADPGVRTPMDMQHFIYLLKNGLVVNFDWQEYHCIV
jgi:hypothetical protein